MNNSVARPLTLNPSPPMGARKVCLSRLMGILVVALCITGCRSSMPNEKLSRFGFNEPHMGTLFSVTLYAPDADAATAAAEAAFQRVAKLDRMMTDYDPKSELMQLCGRPVGEPTHVSPELFELLQESVRVARETDGAFDITVGPFVRAWRAARKTRVLPTAVEIVQMREFLRRQ